MSDDEQAFSVAIIGTACRFADISGLDQLWTALLTGHEFVDHFTPDQARLAGADDGRLADQHLVLAGGVLDGAESFDADFFRMSAREAREVDPQHRVFLESCWHALEDAGHDPARFTGEIGVFGGTSTNTYLPLLGAAGIEPATPYGNEVDFLTSRVAYQLGLTGPSVTVQAGCSTSLLAVHLAAQSLLNYECDLALAGAAYVVTSRRHGYVHTSGGQLSPDGRCRPFDAAADGCVPADGVAVVVLRRLEDAVAEDNVLAVLRGSAVRNDGRRTPGFGMPSVDGLAATMRAACAAAEIAPDEVERLEAHAIGTPWGDAIEVAAVAQLSGVAKRTLGSVKSMIGHTDTVSGLAGLLTAVAEIRNRTLLPVRHFATPNTSLDLDAAGMEIVPSAVDWPDPGRPRRAGVTSSTAGGTNVHVVVEQAPPTPPRPGRPGPHLVVLSAKTPSALRDNTTELSAYLRARPRLPLADIAFTLRSGRAEFDLRRVVVATDVADLVARLDNDEHIADDEIPVLELDAAQERLIDAAPALAARFEVVREHSAEAVRVLDARLDPAVRAWVAGGGFTGPNVGLPAREAALIIYFGLMRLWVELGLLADIEVNLGEVLAGTAGLPALDPSPLSPGDPVSALCTAVGAAWCRGRTIRWPALRSADHGGVHQPRRVSLPGYSFQRRRHWVDTDVDDDAGTGVRSRPEHLGAYVEPASDVERTLAEIWAEALDVTRVGVTDSFYGYGGDSVLALKVATRIRALLVPDIPTTVVLTSPTIRELAAVIGQRGAAPAGPALTRADRRSVRELRAAGDA
ncbi:MAG TPA: beta-ketoacyl synthase N-terminal-like domain-containing protein [Pseudonocardiaceae bacterium]|nr:beta-ketoacyl synthase N-terminal-like domain-containing protein [Pseudonocardiaceae bacterium]